MKRRDFIIQTSLLALSFSPTVFSATKKNITQSNEEDFKRFIKISQFLTEKVDLDNLIAKRIYITLRKQDVNFNKNLQELDATIANSQFLDVNKFIHSELNKDPLLFNTVKTITKAWYTGYIGTATPLYLDDNTQFITYRDALMYRVTTDTTVIPSFSKWSYNYWVTPPVSSV